MALNDEMERRMLNWARWKLTGGAGVLGFSAVQFAAADMPREPYADAPIPTSNIEASEMDDAVKALPPELRATVEIHYLDNESQSHKLGRLGITKAALYLRIGRAHRVLSDHFMARLDRQRVERLRVSRLVESLRPRASV